MSISFAQAQFGKPIDQITADDLVTYFSTERDESLTLEFKSFFQREGDIKHKENGVLRTICGFLNSNGGLVIWGAPIGSKNTEGQKVFTGDLSPVEKRYTRDDFISKMSNRLVPFSASVQFQSVEISPNKFVYLIDVPESDAKPHQFDNSYYMRLDGQTKFAPHYVIDALFKQIRIPVLTGYLRIVGLAVDSLHFGDNITIRLDIDVTIFNESKNINDTGVYVQLLTTDGTFIPKKNPSYLYNDKMVFVTEASPLITYALSTQCSFSLLINLTDYHNIHRQQRSIDLTMSFGSKNSNTKSGHYSIRLKNYSIQGEAQFINHPNVLQRLILFEKEENISMNEVWQGDEHERHQLILKGI